MSNLPLKGQWVDVIEQEIILIEQTAGLHTENVQQGVFVLLYILKG